MNTSEHFKKLSKIGHGGMAEVYRAEVDHSGIKKIVALKQILSTFSNISHFKKNFRYEAMLAMELNHPNIVQVFDFGQTADGHLYMMMEYVEGLDLMSLIKHSQSEGISIPQGICVHIIIEILKALDYAHRLTGPDGVPRKLVHRDISPQNILISYDGAVKVTDFGIAKAAIGEEEEETGVLKGKLRYMSPEQAKAENVDARSDIFSTGLILYELITGHNPYISYKGKGEKALEAVRKAEIPPPSRFVDLDIELEQIISKALEPSKEQRFQRSRDMQVALSKYLHSLPELYDATSLEEFIEKLIPQRKMDNVQVLSTGLHTHTMEFSSTHREYTYELSGTYNEVKSLVLMKVYFGGVEEALKEHSKSEVTRVLNSLSEMVKDITLHKDKQQRYTVKQNSDRELEIIRGIPYTGEYDETEVLLDAHRIRDAFGNYKGSIDELQIGISVYRANVNIVQNRTGIEGDVLLQDAINAKDMASIMFGEIIVSPFIHISAKYNWEFEKIENFDELSEKSLNIIKKLSQRDIFPLYRLIRQKSQIEQRKTRIYDEFVGRKASSEQLRQIFHSGNMGGKAESVAVIGEMGIGKTALVQDFVRNITIETEIITTEARPYYQNTPFNFILGLIYDFLGLNPNESNKNNNIANVINYRVPSKAVADILNEAVSHIFQTDTSEVTNNKNIIKLLSQAIADLLSLISSQKAVIAVFEDLQWADEQSKLVLNDLLSSYHYKGKVLIILSGREIEYFNNLNVKYFIELKPLSYEEIITLLNLKFYKDDKSNNLINLIVAQADGNPFVINEVVATLIDFNYVEEYEGKLKLIKEIQDDPMFLHSPTVEGIVSSRLDALPTHSKYVLRFASVIGKYFSKDILSFLIHKEEQYLLPKGISLEIILDSLIKKKIIKKSDQTTYYFVQQFVRDYAYKSTPEETRKKAHLYIADYLSSSEFNPLQDAPIIAGHYERGGDLSKTIKYYFIAGHAARRLSSNRDAVKLYKKIIKYAADNENLIEDMHHAYKDLEIIYKNLGKRDEQFEMILFLKKQAEKYNKKIWLVDAMCREMAYFQSTGKPLKSVELFDSTFKLAQSIDNSALQATALKVLARAKVDMGKLDRAYAYTTQGLQIISSEKNKHNTASNKDYDRKLERIEAELLHVRGNVLFYKGQIEEASQIYEKSLNIFRKLSFRTDESTIEMNLGFIAAMKGEFVSALQHYRKSYETDIQSGDRLHTGMKQANIALVHIDLGFYEDAEKMIKKAVHLCDKTKDIGGLSDSTLTFALLKIRQKKYNQAMKLIHRGIEYAKQADSTLDEIRGLILWATCQIEDPYGVLEEAKIQAEKAILLSERSQAPSEWVHSLSLLALTLDKIGNSELAYQKSIQALALSTVTFVPSMESVFYIHSLIMKSRGELWWASQYVRKAYEIVMRKADSILTANIPKNKSESLRQKYLTVKPAVSIIDTYNQIYNEIGF